MLQTLNAMKTGKVPGPSHVGLQAVDRVLEKRIHRRVTANEMEFGFMPETGTIYTVFVLRRSLEEYH